MILGLMGVSGSEKTTVAPVLAARLGWSYKEGDDLHAPPEIAKMVAGHPLSDVDRQAWLQAVAAWIDKQQAIARPGIITCSALKRSYRKIIIGDRTGVRLVYLHADPSLLAQRIGQREGHFMPASLLPSQLQTLEAPTPDEQPIIVDIDSSPDEIATRILHELGIEGIKEPS